MFNLFNFVYGRLGSEYIHCTIRYLTKYFRASVTILKTGYCFFLVLRGRGAAFQHDVTNKLRYATVMVVCLFC